MSTVQEALKAREKRKKAQTEAQTNKINSALESYKKRKQSNSQSAATDLAKRINAEIETIKTVSSPSWGEGSLKTFLESTRESRLNVGKLKREVESYKSYLDEETYNSLFSTVSKLGEGYNSYIKNAEVMEKFDSEDSYNKWYEEYKKQEDEKQAVLGAEDFDEYSKLGANTVNPSWEAAHAPLDIGGWKPFGDGETITNMVSFAEANREEAAKASAQAVRSGGTSKYGEIVDLINSYMKDEEKAIYNYYVGKGDTEKANEYLEYITDILRQRQAGKIVEQVDDNFGEILLSPLAGLDQFVSGVKNIDNFIMGTEGDATSTLQYAQTGASSNNEGIWKVTNDLLNTTGNMLPSILVGSVTGGLGGAITMGTSAVGNSYAEMRNLGYDEWQSRGYAALTGASETLLQYALGGISKLGGKVSGNAVSKLVSKIDNAFARTAIKLGGSMASEGLEEAIQTVLEPAFKALMTGEDFEGAEWDEILYSGLLGALSAGFLEGAPTIAGTVINSAQAKKIYGVNDGVDLVYESLAIDPDNAHARRMKGRLDAGKNISGYQLNRLVEANESALVSQDKGKMKAAVEARLTELGESGDVGKLAEIIVKTELGEKLTPAEKKAISNSTYADWVSDELSTDPVNKGFGEEFSNWAESIGTERINTEAYNRGITEASEVSAPQAKTASVTENTLPKENATEAKIEAPKVSKVTIEKDGEKVEVKPQKIASFENGEMSLELEGGEVVNASEVDFGEGGVGLVYQAAQDMSSRVGGFNVDTANVFVRGYDAASGQSAGEYINGWISAYKFGTQNSPVSALTANSVTSKLTEEQRKTAYNFGRAFGNEKVVNTVSKNDAKISKTDSKKKKGRVIFDGAKYGKTLNERQRASLKALNFLSKALGKDIYVENLEPGDNGWYDPRTGDIHVDLNAGVDGEALLLNTTSHELTHDIRTRLGEKFNVLADAVFEEYTKRYGDHVMEDLIDAKIDFLKEKGDITENMTDEEAYDLAYEEVICDCLETMLVDSDAIEALSKNIYAKDKTLWQKIKDFFARLVARIKAAYADVVPDSEEGQRFRDLGEGDERIKKLWVEAIVELSELGTEAKTDSGDVVNVIEDGQFYKVRGEDAVRLSKEVDLTLTQETVNGKKVPMVGFPLRYFDTYAKKAADKGITLEKATVKHSYSSIAYSFFGDKKVTVKDFENGSYTETEGYKRYVENCLDNMRQTSENFNEEAARKEIEDSIAGIVKVAVAMKKAGYDILDNHAKRNAVDSKNRLLFSSLEPNSDYFTSSDISTICDKRINFAEIYDEIVRREEALGVPKGKRFFDNVDNYFILHKIMADKGLTQPCRQCYVESMRKNLAPMANAFLELMQETDPDNKANKQLYQPSGKSKGELKSNNAKLRENLLEAITEEEYTITANDLTVEMLTTEDGLAQLKLQAPLIYEAFNSFYGQSKPKMPKSATPFRFGELTAMLTDNKGKIKKSLIDKIMSTGGFRLQSYSDFQIQNFADVLQVIFEAGTLGLSGHAYTKVPAFLDATKGTNLKRNISIFMYNDGGEWKIDRNDSFPYDLDKIYDIVKSDKQGNTTIIAVSQNEMMAAWIMANDNVGYFIPFHKSGMKMGTVRETIVKEGGREIKGYSGIKDHTRQQTEVWAKTTADHKANTKVKKGINIYEFWDFDNIDNLSREGLIEKNVKAYIDACEKAGYLPKFREYVMNNSKVLNAVLNYSKQLGFVSQNASVDDISFEYKGYRIPYGYYKCLGDFGMFTPDGEASPIERLSLKDYDFDEAEAFFSNAESLRRNEILQQIANGSERERYITGDKKNMTTAEIAEEIQSKRNQVVEEVVSGEYKKKTKKEASKLKETDLVNLLKDVKAKKLADGTYIPVRINTPQILIAFAKEYGYTLENLPLAMRVYKARQAVSSVEEWDGDLKDTPHNLKPQEIVEIIRAMDNPSYLVYQTKNDRFAEIVKFDMGKEKAYAIIDFSDVHKNAEIMNGYNGGKYNILVTVYPSDNVQELKDYLKNKDNKVMTGEEMKKKGLSQRGLGSYVPAHLNESPFFEDIVPQNPDSVKRKNSHKPSQKSTYSSNNDSGEDFNIDDYSIEELLNFTPEQYQKAYKSLGLEDIFSEEDYDDLALFGGDDITIDDISEELNVEPEKVEILVRRKGLGESHIEESRTAVMTQSRINEAIEDSGAKFNPDYARKYITRISPKDFIDLTVSQNHVDREQFDVEVKGDHGSTMSEFDYEKALQDSRSPYLHIVRSTGRIIGHNGRHRIRALEIAGIESVEIEVEFYDEDGYLIKYNANTVPDMAISSQFDTAIETHLSTIIPLNEAHRAEIESTYGEKTHSNAGVRYQHRATNGMKPRTLLANALEGAVTEDERNLLQTYKDNIDKLNREQEKLEKVMSEIDEIRFKKSLSILGEEMSVKTFESRAKAKAEKNGINAEDVQFKLDRSNAKYIAYAVGHGTILEADKTFRSAEDNAKLNELWGEAKDISAQINTYDRELLKLQAMKPIKDVLQREKAMAYKRATEKAEVRRKESVEKVRDSAAKTEAKIKLQKLILQTSKWISYPGKDDVKCPDILREPYAKFLEGIDLSSKRLLEGGAPTHNDDRVANAMNNLANAIERIKNAQDPSVDTDKVLDSGYLDLPVEFVGKLREMAENISKMMVEGDYVINRMSAADVKQLSKLIRTLNHAIKEMSTLYASLRFANIEALGDNSITFLEAMGEAKNTNAVADFVGWDNALPYYAFKRFGEGGEAIFEGLMDGQDKLARLAKMIFDFKDKTWTDKESKAWGEDTHTIELPSGNTLTLTTANAMGIYCLSRREQGLQHLLGGGTRVIGIKKGTKKAADSRSTLTQEDINAIVASLTDRQKKVALDIQKFMSEVCAEWGNEISMKRFLTKEFPDPNYYPIESNDENLAAKDPQAQKSDLYRLLNISATKPLAPGANNEVIIRNIFDVFVEHASDMAKLNAYGLPLLDYMKWVNYREKTSNDNGQIKVRGVHKSMTTAYGDKAWSYVLNLIKDVNGRFNDNADNSFLMNMMRMQKTASVGNNLRVAFLQFTSYPRASLVLSTKSLALGLTKKPQIEKAKKYCGIALWKSYGFYDTNIARSIEDQLKGTTSIRQKIIELTMKGPEWADALTWGCLWNACEYEVAKTTKNKVGSEEFYQEVGLKLREVVYATQVVDSILTRSQIMRSKSGLTQTATAYMSEPTLTANILMDAAFQFQKEKRISKSAKTAWKKTGKIVIGAVGNYLILQLITSIAESLADAWRDDDEEEFPEKFVEAFGENLITNLIPFNKIPIISDIADLLLSFFGIGFVSSDNLSTSWLTQAANAVKAWSEVLGEAFGDKEDENYKETSKTVYNAIYQTAKALSSMSGVSVSGAMREVVAVWNNTAGAIDPTLKIRQYDLTGEENRKGLYEAMISGDENKVAWYEATYEDDSAIQSAIRKALRENDPRIKEAAEAKVNGDSAEANRIAEEIAREGHFSRENIKAAIKSEVNNLMPDDTSEETSTEDKDEAISFYDPSDINAAFENGETAHAKEIIADLINTKVANGKTEKEAKSSLRSSMTSYWKPLYKNASESERIRIRKILYNSGLYGNADEVIKSVNAWLKD